MQQCKLRIEDMAAEERPSNRLMSNGATSLKQLSAIGAPQLMKIHGIKSGKAVQIVACFELARRLETFDGQSKFKINSPEDVYRRLYPTMRESKKEHFVELCLDTKNQVIREDNGN
jgi:DNA repair protein RadC